MTSPHECPRPLAAMRIVDLCGGQGELASRFLADLGADVIRVESPAVLADRSRHPSRDGANLHAVTHNANKRVVQLDLTNPADLDSFWKLIETAELVIEDGRPGAWDAVCLGPAELRNRCPRLVVVSITDFGQSGPYRDWVATEQVHLALGGVLSRSGLPGLPPLLPPGDMATESANLQAAWAALVAFKNALDTGIGDHVDVSIFEATAQVFDPGFGIGGSAAAGKPGFEGPRGRPDARHLYPIFPCADGAVRLCILAPRQWLGMFRWLGEPAELADPALTAITARYKAADRIYPAIRRLFATRTRAEIVAEGRTYGVPAAGLLDAGEVLTADHFTARNAFIPFPVAGGAIAQVTNGMVELDGVRAGIRMPVPGSGHHTDEILKELSNRQVPGEPPSATSVVEPNVRRPLEGIRVLDLGVIVVGAETGRLFADMGAEVIKVENRAFPDGSRQSGRGDAMSITFAWGHRNKLGLGLNLRDERGAELFRRLAASCDVVLSNFKPGTLDSLGLSYETLAAINPGIVVAESSAFGPTGPWSGRMGYGPLVRAETGVTAQWRYPDLPDGYSDASTVYPDHVAARVIATSVLARLIERRTTGRGGRVSVAQAEVILTQYASALAAESLEPGSFAKTIDPIAADAPRGTYPCAGDDEWVTVTVRDDDDWRALAPFLGSSELLTDPRFAGPSARAANRAELDALLSEWTAQRAPREAMTHLQSAGVPAGMMQRVTELSSDPHLCARGFLRTMTHPLLRRPVPTENAPAIFTSIADPDLRPAPMPGQHTRQLCSRLLGLSDEAIDELIVEGVVEEWRPDPGSEGS
ncbi:MAG: hypothetical protein JWN96_2941 [Mycobacterium sp.]|nr:hypothetical protein [Mycobacterium sp.]